MQRWIRFLPRVLAAVCAAYFAFWACAPPAAMPPPVPHAAGAMEIGGAAVGGGALGTPGSCLPSEKPCFAPFADGMAWYLYAPTERFSFGPVAFGGTSTLLGGGLFARYRFNQSPRFFVGAEVSSGWLWASLGLPLSVGVTDRVWLYTRPSVGMEMYGPFHVPVGAAWSLSDAWRLSAEVGARFPGGSSEYTLYEGPTVHGALGLSRGF